LADYQLERVSLEEETYERNKLGVLVMAPAGILLFGIKSGFAVVFALVAVLLLPGSGMQLTGLTNVIKNAYEFTHFQDQLSLWAQSGPVSQIVSPIVPGE
jgi:hypothetical protein